MIIADNDENGELFGIEFMDAGKLFDGRSLVRPARERGVTGRKRSTEDTPLQVASKISRYSYGAVSTV